MINIKLAGLTWRVWGPSLFEHLAGAGNVQIAFDGKVWRVGLFDGEAYSAEAFPTREAAAAMVASCFNQAWRNQNV